MKKKKKKIHSVSFPLEIAQNSQENACARGSFFNKVAGLRPAPLLKKSPWHSCFPANFVKFLKNIFYGTPPDQTPSGRERKGFRKKLEVINLVCKKFEFKSIIQKDYYLEF